MSKLRVLSLFAGIGGFDLGLERTGGFKTVAFCEIDKAAQKVLRKHWPEVPIYDDVRTLGRDTLAADGIAVDVIVGGFPCQDISTAGRGLGLAGERSGLWSEIARLAGELRPSFVIVENVSALLGRGLGDVLGDLAEIGYDAEWHCIPASYVGAPHRRDRIWIVAHPALMQRNGSNDNTKIRLGSKIPQPRDGSGETAVADPQRERQSGPWQSIFAFCPKTGAYRQAIDAVAGGIGSVWAVEPDVGRVAHGVPARMDRLKQLGNAVVPQVVELIGRAILASIEEERAAA